MDVKSAKKKLYEIGEKLGFKPYTEVRGPGSITIDVVWFDKDKLTGEEKPILQGKDENRAVAAFEIETSYWSKPLKGDIFNLEKCGAKKLVIVIPPRKEIDKHIKKHRSVRIWGRSVEDDIKAIKRDSDLACKEIDVLPIDEIEKQNWLDNRSL